MWKLNIFHNFNAELFTDVNLPQITSIAANEKISRIYDLFITYDDVHLYEHFFKRSKYQAMLYHTNIPSRQELNELRYILVLSI